MAWAVMSRVTKTAWDVLSGVANLCGMFCPGCQKMAWDVLSGSRANQPVHPRSLISAVVIRSLGSTLCKLTTGEI